MDIDINDPFNIEDHIQKIGIQRPELLYQRRKSCCCTGCKQFKYKKGLNIVLEDDF